MFHRSMETRFLSSVVLIDIKLGMNLCLFWTGPSFIIGEEKGSGQATWALLLGGGGYGAIIYSP